MTTTVNLRKILDRKQTEFCCPAPTASGAFMHIASSRLFKQMQYYLVSATSAFAYFPDEDAWIELPSPALTNAIGAGSCGTCTPIGPSGTATAGSTSTITTNLTLARDLRGYSIRITGGPSAAGNDLVILSNTVGANAIITVATQGVAFTNATTYTLLTTRWYVFAGATLGANGFRYYDYATNVWTTGGLTGSITAATVFTIDGRLIATPSIVNSDEMNFVATGSLATAGGASTLTKGTASWTASQWVNYQVRIIAGTGAGQTRTISANTPTVLTTSTAWTIQPSTDSEFVIEGNDDYLYLLGSNSTALYRYSISDTTWTTLASRGGASIIAASGHWIFGSHDTKWENENAIINGRRIYSFRGGSSSVIDYYDIPSNTWTNAITYAPATTNIVIGTKYTVVDGRYIYIAMPTSTPNRWLRFDPVLSQLEPAGHFLYTQGAACAGDTAFDVTYTEGTTNITWVYLLLNTSQVMLRMMLI